MILIFPVRDFFRDDLFLKKYEMNSGHMIEQSTYLFELKSNFFDVLLVVLGGVILLVDQVKF